MNLLRYFFSAQQKLVEKSYSRQNAHGTVLMFHEVYADGQTPKKKETAVSFSEFKRIINAVEPSRFCKVTCYDDILKLTTGQLVLTFDDVFSNAFALAFPYLERKQIPYIAFVCTEFLDKEGYISSDDLMWLQRSTYATVGSHGGHHVKYRHFAKELKEDAEETAKQLQTKLFAYPYGSFFAVSEENRKAISDSGVYDCAFSTVSAKLTDESVKQRWMLPRICVKDGFDIEIQN